MYNLMFSNIVNNYVNFGWIVYVYDLWNIWKFCNFRWVFIFIYDFYFVYIIYSFFVFSMFEMLLIYM